VPPDKKLREAYTIGVNSKPRKPGSLFYFRFRDDPLSFPLPLPNRSASGNGRDRNRFSDRGSLRVSIRGSLRGSGSFLERDIDEALIVAVSRDCPPNIV
jgi:hypothetical protein